MKHEIEEENGTYVVYSYRDYYSNPVKIPILRTNNVSEAELMLKYLTEA